MSLEGYLADQYNRDLQDVREIDLLLADVAAMFAASFDQRGNCWPYELKIGDRKLEGKRSQGTSAMILAAVGKMAGLCTLRDGSISEKIPGLPIELADFFGTAVGSLAEQLSKERKVKSNTFGANDPLTISHLTELMRGLRKANGVENKIEAALFKLPEVVNKIDKLMAQGVTDRSALKEPGRRSSPYWCAKSAFIALRVSRAHTDLDRPKPTTVSYRTFFESRLHEQLSFSSIPDSRFDPAELAFCLEGLLICARESVDPVLFERVLAVLGAEQETSAYWRPNRPFIAKPTGEIMLPLSVEGANSLLRSVEMMDKSQLYGTFSAKAVPMFRRFWQWLRARKVEINALGAIHIGWHSEHVNEAGAIHLWDTSQVIEFLVAFRKLLQRHVARETLVLSRVKVGEPVPLQNWSDVVSTYEPLTDGVGERVFDQVYKDFVKPWTVGDREHHSMLLYGPPGTGKTKIASSIANALTFRLITVTVSDFLGAGGALVEARAKAIFQMLEAQSNCVILFDEIDAFLLDRDSEHYRRQDTLFQFLTPGMLTKINDLREAARSIFIIATNYANRIDPAIKRPGRIDRQYLLLPPDLGKRREIIDAAFKRRRVKFTPAEIDEMAKASLYLGYKEIVGAVDSISAATSVGAVIEALEATLRSSSHQHYLARLEQETTFPKDEFVAIARMARESDKISSLNEDIRVLGPNARSAWGRVVKSPDLRRTLSSVGVEI